MDIVHFGAGSSGSSSVAAATAGAASASGGHVQALANNPFDAQPPGAATSQASLSHEENGPILYDEPNRTSAIDDIRSGVIYAFIFTLFFTFFLILPGIRNEKFPTILCIVPSLLVASIIVISIFGTTWHVGEVPNISAAYKAFSRDRIQDGPIVLENMAVFANEIEQDFKKRQSDISATVRRRRSLKQSQANVSANGTNNRQTTSELEREVTPTDSVWTQPIRTKTTIRRLNVDINYNERFYWIEPQQMRHEYHNALARGLPYPILTVVEYLSQDDAGFNWSRQYRSAGYYTSILLWLSFCVCILMFCLHCATPKYGIYTMQLLGLLLLFSNFIYAILVPRGERELVIPFEGQSLRFRFGWNFWLVMIGGCVSLVVGTLIIVVEHLKPNFIFTTVLDVDFDRNYNQSRQRQKCIMKHGKTQLTIESFGENSSNEAQYVPQKLKYPPFMSVESNTIRLSMKEKQQQSESTLTWQNPKRHSPKTRRRIKEETDTTRHSISASVDIRLTNWFKSNISRQSFDRFLVTQMIDR